MKHCKYCGAQLADDDDYCYFCGRVLEEKTEQTFNNYNNNGNTQATRRNVLARIGFVIAFFSPMIGLILSIVALNIAKNMNNDGKKYAIAGIIISVVTFVLSMALYFLLFYYFGEEW